VAEGFTVSTRLLLLTAVAGFQTEGTANKSVHNRPATNQATRRKGLLLSEIMVMPLKKFR
jgi:hypothetical protein